MITFEQITKLFSFDTKKKYCVEIQFMLDESKKFDYCWMGKMWDTKEEKDIYWYGLTADGTNAYDYVSFHDMATAPVFDGRSLIDVWDQIVIEEIDDCDPIERLLDYIGDNQSGHRMGTP